MGIYLNPNSKDFQESLNSEIYVDKSMIIKELNKVINTKQKYICVSRPRRFGKSMTLEMLNAYYSCGCSSKDMFKNLKVSKINNFGEYLNNYNVLFFNIHDFLSLTESVEEMLNLLEELVLEEINEEYQEVLNIPQTYLTIALNKIYSKTGKPFIILIDEWDCIFRVSKNDTKSQEKYLDFLRNFLKDKKYVALAYMTGILPIKKYGIHSALNMFTEISMINAREYAEFTGFTESEVKELCTQYGMSFEDIKKWYDGYNLKGISIYNPRSVVMSLTGHDYDNYWTQTETYEALKVYITMNFEGLRDVIVKLISGGTYKIDTGTFSNDMTTFNRLDDILTLLVHLGYLSYNSETQEVRIPNYEISKEFISVIEISKWDEVVKAIKQSMELLENTWLLNENDVAKCVEEVHRDNTSILTYNSENTLSCVITLAYYSAKEYYNIVRELPTGKGFADIVMIPNRKHLDKPALVIELKYNKNVDTAINQILRNEYPNSLKDYYGNMLLVGINYNEKKKEHTCKIMEYQK